MFGAYGWIVESGGNGMRGGDLAVFGLQNISVGALQNARTRSCETLRSSKTRGVFAEFVAAAAGFNADHFHGFVFQEFMK